MIDLAKLALIAEIDMMVGDGMMARLTLMGQMQGMEQIDCAEGMVGMDELTRWSGWTGLPLWSGMLR